jgi:hypothetical protein
MEQGDGTMNDRTEFAPVDDIRFKKSLLQELLDWLAWRGLKKEAPQHCEQCGETLIKSAKPRKSLCDTCWRN